MLVLNRSKDDVLWLKHIMGDTQLVAHLAAVPEGSLHRFAIGNCKGTFQKMKQGKNPYPTPGFKPVGEIRDWWQDTRRTDGGTVVQFSYLGPEE
jgi:hypothetical protein